MQFLLLLLFFEQEVVPLLLLLDQGSQTRGPPDVFMRRLLPSKFLFLLLKLQFYVVLQHFLRPFLARGDIFASSCGPRTLFTSRCGPRAQLSLRPLFQTELKGMDLLLRLQKISSQLIHGQVCQSKKVLFSFKSFFYVLTLLIESFSLIHMIRFSYRVYHFYGQTNLTSHRRFGFWLEPISVNRQKMLLTTKVVKSDCENLSCHHFINIES